MPLLKREKTIGCRLPETDTTPPEVKIKAQAAFDRAHELIRLDKYGEALKVMREVVSRDPFHARAQNDLAVLYLTSGNKEQALAHLSLALQLDPGNTDTAKNLADVYLELDRTEDALQTFLDIVNRHPHDVEALFHLGTACASLGMKEQAGKLYAKVLDLVPNHPGAKKGLALIRQSGSNG